MVVLNLYGVFYINQKKYFVGAETSLFAGSYGESVGEWRIDGSLYLPSLGNFNDSQTMSFGLGLRLYIGLGF